MWIYLSTVDEDLGSELHLAYLNSDLEVGTMMSLCLFMGMVGTSVACSIKSKEAVANSKITGLLHLSIASI